MDTRFSKTVFKENAVPLEQTRKVYRCASYTKTKLVHDAIAYAPYKSQMI
jgi:hypothetical protein